MLCLEIIGEIPDNLGAVSIRKTVLLGMAIPMLKIRRPTGRLIFNMGIPIPGKTVFLIETGPCYCNVWGSCQMTINKLAEVLLSGYCFYPEYREVLWFCSCSNPNRSSLAMIKYPGNQIWISNLSRVVRFPCIKTLSCRLCVQCSWCSYYLKTGAQMYVIVTWRQ